MSYDIRIKLKEDETPGDVFRWIDQQGWQYMAEWRWYSPDFSNGDTRYTFQFDNDKHVAWFMLRWS